ncbi:MAG: Maf family protein [Flavobacteriaceae bacterium]|nr:Maf family protein [Flavobacteriaceae bacterium]
MKIILASQSPRRQELLKSLGYDFTSVSPDIDESYPPELKALEITEFLAKKKSLYFGKVDENTVVITADTIVWLDGRALEKPKNQENAKEMLRSLSGKTHHVYTSVGFTTSVDFQVFTDVSEVHFSDLTEEEIVYYVQNFNPLDKAGAYGIQDWMGLAKIDQIKGSYFTIMGFPSHLVYRYLSSL